MIKFLQSGNKAAKYLLAGLLLILCVGMVMYLIPGFMSDASVTRTGTVASVGSQEISSEDVQRLAAQIQQQQAMRGQRYPDAFMGFLRQQAFQRLLQEAEIRYQGDKMGLRVSDDEVREELHSPGYADTFFPKGQWIGQDKYEQLLQNAGYTPQSFEQEMRSNLLARKVMNAVVAGIDVTPSEIEKNYKEQNTKVKFDYAVISMDDIQKQIKPTDAELKAFYEANKGRYQNSIPEKRQVKYFVINDQQVESKVTVTPTDLEKYYRDNQDRFKVPDRVKVRHILIKTPAPGPDGKVDQKAVDEARKKAEDILKQIKGGADFAELAKKNSDDPGSKAQGGELSWVIKGQTVPEFEKAAFSMNKGQISDLVQTSYGFHIIQTEEKEYAHMKPLAEVKSEIEPDLKKQKVAEALNKMATEAENMAKAQGIEKAAAQYNAKVLESNPVSRTDTLPGVGAAPELMTAIFTADQKSGAQAARTPEAYVIFHVEKIVPPSSPAFEAIKDRVAGDFKAERSNQLLSQKTQELADRAHTQHDLKKAAKELGATVKTSELVGHTSQVPDLGSMSGQARAAFDLQQGQISGPLSLGNKGAVLMVTERQEANLGDDFGKAKDNIREQLLSEKRQQALELFINNLQTRLEKEGKLKINKDAMDNLTKMRG